MEWFLNIYFWLLFTGFSWSQLSYSEMNLIKEELQLIGNEIHLGRLDVNPEDSEKGNSIQVKAMMDTIKDMETEFIDLEKLVVQIALNIKTLRNLNKTLILPEPPEEEACGKPFYTTPLGCIWVHLLPSLDFDEAREYCQVFDGDLLEPTDISAVQKFMQEFWGHDWVYFWVGAKRRNGDKFYSISGEPINIPRRELHVPSNLKGGPCMAINGGRNWKPMPFDCENQNLFICEKKI